MTEIVAYHSRSTMRCPKSDNFFMNTNKSLANIQGNYIWVIEGLGNKKYKLKMRYLAETISEGEVGFKFSFSSATGDLFDIDLHEFDWFDDFKRSVSNFSICPTPLHEPFLSKFKKIARSSGG